MPPGCVGGDLPPLFQLALDSEAGQAEGRSLFDFSNRQKALCGTVPSVIWLLLI